VGVVGGVFALLLVVEGGAGGFGEPLVAQAGFGDVADCGVEAGGAFDLLGFVGGEAALIVPVAPVAVHGSVEIVGRGEAGAPFLGMVAPPDGVGAVGGTDERRQSEAKLRKLRFARARVIGRGSGGRGCEREEAGGLGTGPLFGAPVCACGGIEIGDVDLGGEPGTARQPAVGARDRGEGGEIAREVCGAGGGIGGGAAGRGAGREARGEEQTGARGRRVLLDQV
jgi:hypothetical protein